MQSKSIKRRSNIVFKIDAKNIIDLGRICNPQMEARSIQNPSTIGSGSISEPIWPPRRPKTAPRLLLESMLDLSRSMLEGVGREFEGFGMDFRPQVTLSCRFICVHVFRSAGSRTVSFSNH